MGQNKKKIINLFIGNISNSVVHKILEKSIDEENLRKHYNKELIVSFEIAKRYREKINPKNIPLPERYSKNIEDKIIKRVKSELNLRITKGYEIDVGLIKPTVKNMLRKIKIIKE